jgi:hypothetical protein
MPANIRLPAHLLPSLHAARTPGSAIRYNSSASFRTEKLLDIARPFVRLPFAFDAKRLADEAAALPASAWMAHPNRMTGNSAVALISRDGGDNDDFDGRMQTTPHLEACPYIGQAIASFGEVFGRSRLMKLAAGAEVSTHVDFNYHWYTRVRIHIPVVTNPEVTFYCADQQTHMRAGECWIFNSWRRHRVSNISAEDRVHLVIDTAGSSRFWQIVRRMAEYDSLTQSGEIDELATYVPYEPGKETEIFTEQYNTAPVMSPGEVDALVDGVIGDFLNNPDNDPTLARQYQLMLQDFAKDWREIWHLHGYQEQGWPKYQQVIDNVFEQLHPDPRALLTQSNKVGVNPVVVQRILRAALATATTAQFVGPLGSKS